MANRDLLLGLVAASLSWPAMAADFQGVRIGMSQEDAVRALSAGGPATTIPFNDPGSKVPQTVIMNDTMNATICRGRVNGMTRSLTNTFATWAREMRIAVAERGEPTVWWASNNEADPESHSVQARWEQPGAPSYTISYMEVAGQCNVLESMFMPCQ